MYCIPAFSVMPSDADGKRKVICEHSIFQNAVNVISHNTLPAKVVEEVYRCNRVYVPGSIEGFDERNRDGRTWVSRYSLYLWSQCGLAH